MIKSPYLPISLRLDRLNVTISLTCHSKNSGKWAIMEVQERPWTIFLSYPRQDQPFANWLYEKLRGAGITVWYDTKEILTGDSISDKIAEGLSRSDFLLVVHSKAASNYSTSGFRRS